jgi:hypothetical protein
MIYYLVTAGYGHTMRTFLEHWGRDLAGRVRIVEYGEIFRARELAVGTYVFSDLERLLPAETAIAEIVWNQLHAASARLLNHPQRALRRYRLLARLHELGRNDFGVVRATDRDAVFRYPVFIRGASDHGGSLTGILHTRGEVDEALAGAVVRGHPIEDLLIVEYRDTSDDRGMYRKYAAFKVGDRVIPGHIDFSMQWLVKDTDIVTADALEEERRYLETNPHRAWVEELFALAGIDYGRVDYSLLGDRPQVWEINTNPVVSLHPLNYTEAHLPTKRRLAAMMVPAFEALDSSRAAVAPIDVPVALLARAAAERRRDQRAKARVRTVRRIKGSLAFRVFRRVTHPLLRPLAPLLTRTDRKRPR